MKYSEWQDGDIPPEVSGWYQRQAIWDGAWAVIGNGYFDKVTNTWLITQQALKRANTFSKWQIANGDIWRWRGKL
jgi:hypothetical protein